MEYNIYCDESCHLQFDNSDVMIIGSVWFEKRFKNLINNDIRQLKIKHGLSSWAELKWTKVSPSKSDFYFDIINYFINNENIYYRGVVAKGKKTLNHDKYNEGDYDLWYYKMYFSMLDRIIQPHNEYNIYIDIKDTRGAARTMKLQEVLCNNIYDFNREVVKKIAEVDSKRSDALQLADLLNGALAYYNRGLHEKADSNKAKQRVVELLQEYFSLDNTTPLCHEKFNLLVWRGRE